MNIIDDQSLDLGPLEPPLSHTLEERTTDLAVDKNEFCTQSNISSAANYVNILLTAHNYPAPLIFDTDDENSRDIVNCLHALLKDKQREAEDRAELERTVWELKQGQQELESKLENCQQELDQSRRQCMQLKTKVDSTNKTIKEERARRRAVNEELSRAKHNMQYMKAQYAHDTRKHEQEQAKIKERLYKLMGDKQQPNVPSMVINGPLPGSVGYNEDQEISEERAMYTDLLKKSGDREKRALVETDMFRKIAVDIYSAVSDLLARQTRHYNDIFPNTQGQDEERDHPLMRLPLEIGGSEAIDRVHDLLAKLKREWNREIEQRKAYSEEDMARKDEVIARLEENNDELIDALRLCREEFERKASMYMRFSEGNFFDNASAYANPELSDSESSVYEDSTAESRIRRLWSKAKAERQKVTKAAIELGDQRKELAAERWAFEEMKLNSKMQELLGDTDSMKMNHRRTSFSRNQRSSILRKRRRSRSISPTNTPLSSSSIHYRS